MAENYSAIRTFALTTGSYTAIVAPIPCSYFEIIGSSDGSAMTRSSDGTDAHSYPFPQMGWFGFMVVTTPWIKASPRYNAGDTVTYLKATTGTPNVYVEFSL